MENLEQLKAELQKSIDEAGTAFTTKAGNAEAKAKEAFDKAELVLKSMEGMLTKAEALEMKKQLDALDLKSQHQ